MVGWGIWSRWIGVEGVGERWFCFDGDEVARVDASRLCHVLGR